MVWIRVTLSLLLLAFTATAEVVPLTDETFTEDVNSNCLWFINFYTNWCPWSQRLAPEWEKLGSDEEVRQAGVKIGSVDCQASKATCLKAHVQGYPTMKIFHTGETLEGDQAYYGDRDFESMKAFALEMQAQFAPLKFEAAATTVMANSTHEEGLFQGPRIAVGMVLKLFGF